MLTSIVWVFPLAVWPYAKIVALYPERTSGEDESVWGILFCWMFGLTFNKRESWLSVDLWLSEVRFEDVVELEYSGLQRKMGWGMVTGRKYWLTLRATVFSAGKVVTNSLPEAISLEFRGLTRHTTLIQQVSAILKCLLVSNYLPSYKPLNQLA